ncbi:phage portal protein [Mobiluncus mulieris]|uniref:Phage portal protein n=2 Tax=Mobiluncus mulieris TaxID=2052 RepID=A0A7Y0Y537_9ACTO|nr:phage portal protein [Mobiluncus mulieris]NMW65990.1 phage portal protein [Mobiluncus mulieris]
MWQPAEYRVCPGNGCDEWLDARDFIVFRDWNPNGAGSPVSPIEALRDILAEQIEAWKYRRQVWERGGRVGTYISRPAESNGGEWSMEARQRFRADWKAFVASGAKAGSTPILEDGMKLEKVGFSAKEEEWVESTRLSLQTVAQVYHVQPAMIGETSGASYASTREFRSMLYTETLGPLLAMIEKRLNQFLVPRVAPDTRLYVEFNIEAKLAGNFEEQAGILSTATGAPWMTVNEARALRNLPSLPDGDGLVVPLNVVKGGQASPQDGGEPSAAVEAARDGGGQ